MLDEKDCKEISHLMQVIIDSDVTPKFNLLAEAIKNVSDKITPPEDIEAIENRVDALEIALKSIRRDISNLKKAN